MAWAVSHDRAAYEAFCQNTVQVPLCCQAWYLDAVCTEGEWQAVTLLHDDEPVAAWPYFLKHRFGLRYVTMPQFTKYMGVICRPDLSVDLQAEVMTRLCQALPKLSGLDQQSGPASEPLVEHLPKGYRKINYHTHQIQLVDGTNWQAGINRNMRRNIRKAEQQLSLRLDYDLERFHQISALSFERQGLSLPYSFSALQQHDEALARHGRRQIFAAEDAQGRTHSVAYLMWSDEVAYYHLSGDDPALRRSGSGIWLIAQALDFAQERGIQTFDFEGSMIPAIAAIREQFGAQRHSYSRIQMSRSVLYSALKWWRQRGGA